MKARVVAGRDLLAARRSLAIWAVATGLAALAALIAYAASESTFSGAPPAVETLNRLGTVLAVLLPIVALVASYKAIAQERASGGIKFLLGFPNSRLDVYVGKLASRLTIVVGIVLLMFVAAASMVATRLGSLPAGPTLGLFAVSALYAGTFVAVAVSMSALVATRGRAIASAIGAYFVLVILYIFPMVRIPDLVRWFHHAILGYEENPELYAAVAYVSPYTAYQKTTNLVVPEELHAAPFERLFEEGADLPAYLSDEFGLVVLAAWILVPTVLGYLRFQRTDLA